MFAELIIDLTDSERSSIALHDLGNVDERHRYLLDLLSGSCIIDLSHALKHALHLMSPALLVLRFHKIR